MPVHLTASRPEAAAVTWLERWCPRPSARLQLLCLPCAGGSAAAYRGWAAALPDQVELLAAELPGHGRRQCEPALTSMDDLVSGLLTALATQLRRPLAIFGHSMGALIGLELARAIRRQHGQAPAALLVSASDSPALPAGATAVGGAAPLELPDADWRRTLRELGGVDSGTLADDAVMDLLMSALRGDLALLDRYRHRAEQPLGCAVRVYAGDRDESVTEAGLAAWRQESPRDFRLSRLPGGHFFQRESEQLFLGRLGGDLLAVMPPWTPRANGVMR